jgi:mandelamide amidase
MRSGDIKAEDYARALLDRAEELIHLNAFRTLDREKVLESARMADRRHAAGEKLGALHGLPLPVKDSIDTRSLPTSSGTRSLEHFMALDDAAVLKPLFAAGAILMGKTNLHELSFGWTSNNLTFGAVRNPFDPARIPGGSSGGSGVAVAAHMAPLAVAEDTLGSIRIPASMCGLAGLRPSVGRYPAAGIMPITPRFDVPGPLARSVADLILFDSTITGDWSPVPPLPLPGVRIGAADFFLRETDAEVARVNSEALRRLEDAGVEVVRADVPVEVQAALEITRMVNFFEVAATVPAFLAEQNAGISLAELVSKMSPDIQGVFRNFVLPGAPKGVSREQYEAALTQLAALRKAIPDYYAQNNIQALVFPATRMPPTAIGEDKEVDIGGQKVPMRAAMARNVAHGSCAGMPSLVLRGGMTSSGLPVGVEFDALPGMDRELLALGLSLEKALGSFPDARI